MGKLTPILVTIGLAMVAIAIVARIPAIGDIVLGPEV